MPGQLVPFESNARGGFWNDPFFADGWAIIDSQRQQSGLGPEKLVADSTALLTRDFQSDLAEGENGCQVIMDVSHFLPYELQVTANVQEHTVTVDGQHTERPDPTHGFNSRHFTRKFTMPANADLTRLTVNRSEDGVLQVKAPRKEMDMEEVKGEVVKSVVAKPTKYDEQVSSYHPFKQPLCATLPDFHMIPFHDRGHSLLRRNMGIHSDDAQFKVLVDVQDFDPAELEVYCTEDSVKVEGKHVDRKDSHGYLARRFTRQYDLPKSVARDAISCKYMPDGLLEITAPKLKTPHAIEDETRKMIPVELLVKKG